MVFGFGKPNIEKLEKKRDVEGLIKALNYRKDSIIMREAADALGEIEDPSAIIPLIKSFDDVMVSSNAVSALGNIGAPAVEPLIMELMSPSSQNDKLVIKALVEIGEPSFIVFRTLGEPAIELMIMKLSNPNGEVRNIAAEALGNIGDVRAVEPLIGALTDERTYVQESAVEALGKIGDPRAVKPLVQLLNNRDLESSVVQVLTKIGEPAVESLIKAIYYPGHTMIRTDVVSILADIGDVRAVDPLINALNVKSSYDRRMVARSLDKLGWKPNEDQRGISYWIALENWSRLVQIGEPAVSKLINELYNHSQGACDALVKIGEPAVVPLIGKLNTRNDILQGSVAEILGKIGDPRAVEPLIKALDVPDGRFRFEIPEALGLIGDTRAVEPLVKSLNGKYHIARKNSAIALKRFYNQDKIDPQLKNKILNCKSIINEKHTDNDGCGVHNDSGIGLNFY